MARIRITRHQSAEIWKALGQRYPVFEYVHLNQAICLPSACSQAEAEHLVNVTLQKYPLLLTEEFLCDTLQSVSWQSKLENANTAQFIAISALFFVISLCLLGTLVDFRSSGSSFLTDWSIRKNWNALVTIDKRATASRLQMLDYMKFTVIIVGVAGHCLSCLESIPSWYTFARLYVIKSRFRAVIVQPLLNEAGLGLVTFVGGFVTFWSSHTLMRKGTFRMGTSLYEKWIRFMPSIMMMVAIDLLWPMYGSGPMFAGIAKQLLNKCTHNSWMNFFFISNFVTAPENVSPSLPGLTQNVYCCTMNLTTFSQCVPHTFYSSIDMQLFVIGLLVTAVLVKRARVGILLCFTLILLGNVLLVYFTMNNISSPVLIDAEATREKTVNYLDYVHFGTYSHLSNYFIGMLAAYTVTVDGLLLKNAKIVTILYNVAVLMSGTVHFAPTLHNSFGILPQHLVPFYIVTIKFFYVFYFSLFLFTNVNRYAAKSVETQELKSPKDMHPIMKLLMELMVQSNRWIFGALDYLYTAPLFRLVINLAYAVYISNYAYIRYDFFTSRTGMSLSTNMSYSIMTRIVYTLWFVLSFSLLFQLFFVSPFDNVRRRFKNKSDRNRGTAE